MRDSCLNCVRKHIACAHIYAHESRYGYPDHKWLAIGELNHAEQEADKQYPWISKEIQEARKDYEDGLPFNALSLIGLCSTEEEESSDQESTFLPDLWEKHMLDALTTDSAFYKILKNSVGYESENLEAKDTIKIRYNYRDSEGGFTEGSAPDIEYDKGSGTLAMEPEWTQPSQETLDALKEMDVFYKKESERINQLMKKGEDIKEQSLGRMHRVGREGPLEVKSFNLLVQRKRIHRVGTTPPVDIAKEKIDPQLLKTDYADFEKSYFDNQAKEILKSHIAVDEASAKFLSEESMPTSTTAEHLAKAKQMVENHDGESLDWFKANGYRIINFSNDGDSKMVQIISPLGRLVYTGNRYNAAVAAYKEVEDEN